MNRLGFLGGSDVAAVVGLSPWKTAYQLWEEKTAKAEQDDSENGTAKAWGKRLEPVVMECIQDQWDIAIGRRNAVYTHPTHDWARAEIDFEWIDSDGTVCNGDVKTAHWRKAHEWGDEWSDQVPPYYACQFIWGQEVSSREKTLCATMLGVGELRPYLIHWDADMAGWLMENAERFWFKHVLADEPPPIVSSEDAQRAVSRFQGLTIHATPETRTALDRLQGVRAAKKRLDALEAQYKLTVQTQMATAIPDGTEEPKKFGVLDQAGKLLVSWNEQHRAAYTVKPSSFRVFRVH